VDLRRELVTEALAEARLEAARAGVVAVEVDGHQVAERVLVLARRDQSVDVLEEHRELTRDVAREQVLHSRLVRDVRLRLEIRVAADVDARAHAAILEDEVARWSLVGPAVVEAQHVLVRDRVGDAQPLAELLLDALAA